jgi:hypothetical protein
MMTNSLLDSVKSWSPSKKAEISRLLTLNRPKATDLFHIGGMVPDRWQTRVLEDTSPRSLLLCSRQAGKSTVAAVLALYEAVCRPPSLVLLLSPSQRQSFELFKKVVDVYRQLPNPPKAIGDSAAKLELKNGSRILSLPGAEQTIRGYSSVNLLIVDEASRVPDDFYFAVRPMLAVSGGRFIGMSTPWGRRGWFYDAWISDEAWVRHTVTAFEVPRIPAAFLEAERRSMPKAWFNAEYLCEFSDARDACFRDEDIQRAMDPTVIPMFPGGV